VTTREVTGRRDAPAKPAGGRTPLMDQYARIKRDHPDAFLFFRLGDFYEMFFDDAVQAARLLGLTLTSRNRQDPNPIPMCGIPWHQRDPYVARLLRLGHKVAICDQLEDAALAKGLVERGVTEILTPGSVTGDAFLDPAANNFLAALWPSAEGLGLCLADASTGEVKLAQRTWDEAGATLSRLRVSEWVVPRPEDLAAPLGERLDAARAGLAGAVSPVPAVRYAGFEVVHARWPETATGAFDDVPLALAAGSAALDYLDRMTGGAARQLSRVERWREDDTLRYDAATARHLELFRPQPGGEPAHTLWHHLQLAVSAVGARRLRGWIERPRTDLAGVRARHDHVERWLGAAVERGAFRETVKGFPDLERLAARLAAEKATPRDLGALRDALVRLPGIGAAVAALHPGREEREALAGIPELAAILQTALAEDPPPLSREGGILRAGYDAHRDELYALAHSGKRWIAELESAEKTRTGIPSLKIGYNRVFGYYLEVTRPHLDKVPADYERRQTLTTAERFVTPGLKVKEQEVLSAEDRLKAREHEVFVGLRREAASHVRALQRAADALGHFDAEAALAEAAARYGWIRPEMSDSDRLHVEGGRHPVVERLLPRGEFVPNAVTLDGSRRQILLLTGPNMGGKSTYLRQTALIVLLAQAGSFVPAERAQIGIVDRLFTRVGAADRLGAGQSTFMVEMRETADILSSATPRSLVLLDEIGRGTATYDGLALAWAVTEYLHESAGPRPRTIFATHYHELTQLAERLPRLANVHVTVREWQDQVVFLHRIAEGAADRSYGIHVARLAGLPPSILERAETVLRELESERTVAHLAPGGPAAARPAPRPAAGPRNGAQAELPLVAAHPLEDALRDIDPDRLTPIEALGLVAEWKRRFGK
jgi:DNA mismatch repair protein MutS